MTLEACFTYILAGLRHSDLFKSLEIVILYAHYTQDTNKIIFR